MKTAILVTARLKSTRLPLKAIKKIQGKEMISHLLDRLKLAKSCAQIIICTSPNSQDDPLVDIAKQEGVEVFRGDPDDVLLRLTMAAEQFGVDTVVSCTADNPFVDPEYIDKMVAFHHEQGNNFTNVEGLPWGVFSYALSFPSMVKACEIKDEVDTEVWGGYFTQTGLFKCGTLEVVDEQCRRPDLRLTVDTPEDFQLISQIFAHFGNQRFFSLREIIRLCDDRPELAEINSKVVQKPGKPIRLRG